jgi:hypothetical protein
MSRGAVTTPLVAALLVATAQAHWPRPEDVVARIDGARAQGVMDVRPDAAVPRLLVVRVGPPWHALPVAERRALAEAWRQEWREAVPNGLLGVVDAERGAAVVNFDANGRARVAPAAQEAPSMNSVKP